jgi:hypothetical protein
MTELLARLARLAVALMCGWGAAYVVMRLDGQTQVTEMHLSRDWTVLLMMVISGASGFGLGRALLARTRPVVDSDDLRELPARVERVLTGLVFGACAVLLTVIATDRLRLGDGSNGWFFVATSGFAAAAAFTVCNAVMVHAARRRWHDRERVPRAAVHERTGT